MTTALDLFPLPTIRPSQAKVIDEIQKAYEDGNKFVIVEAPVGSGKSAIAITLARYYGQAHLITPRKALQDQYFADFSDHVVMMKGRSAYPCTTPLVPFNRRSLHGQYTKVINQIRKGSSPLFRKPIRSCAEGPCKDNLDYYTKCTSIMGKCPYKVAMEVAENDAGVVHNLHSFVFQTQFAAKFSTRDILIIDEAHEVEGMVRDFVSRGLSVPQTLTEEELQETKGFKDLDQWCNWMLQERFVRLVPDAKLGEEDRTYRDEYIEGVEDLRKMAPTYGESFAVRINADAFSKKTRVEFIPDNIRRAVNELLFRFGEKVLLMSGTIYSKSKFCSILGIPEESAYFIRTSSSFPLESRPIYMRQAHSVDTSHANWGNNLTKTIDVIQEVLDKFDDVKGLIHTPSYKATEEILALSESDRLVGHSREDFQLRLEGFYQSDTPDVFVSPVCWQGVDFKDDRARFQIILRVPYPNSGDEFISFKMKKDFSWYNYQALIVFGQQVGRINRSESDFGVTILVDERFPKFLKRNARLLPKWLKEAVYT